MPRKKLQFYFGKSHESSYVSDGRRDRFRWNIRVSMYGYSISYTDDGRCDDIETDVIQIDDRGDLHSTQGTVGCSIRYSTGLNPCFQTFPMNFMSA